jgi:hypothetical protein
MAVMPHSLPTINRWGAVFRRDQGKHQYGGTDMLTVRGRGAVEPWLRHCSILRRRPAQNARIKPMLKLKYKSKIQQFLSMVSLQMVFHSPIKKQQIT